MWAVRAILIVALVLCVVAFAYYNPPNPQQNVQVNLIWAKYVDVPLITVVFWSFVLGVLVSLFILMSVFIKQSVQLRSARRHVKALEGEVTALRNRPIEESAELVASGETKPLSDKTLFTDSD
jgi:uncharacterized membrane protein YciS (DUF1049 family)